LPQLPKTLPKIQIDEAILVAYTVPAQITKSTSLTDRETVVFRVLPKELLNRLSSINVDLDFHLKKSLRPLIGGKLYFVKYPLPRWKARLEETLKSFESKYQEFARTVFEGREELEKDVQKFVEKYKPDEAAAKSIFDEKYLMERFRIRVVTIVIKLGAALKFDAISSEEIQRIEESVKKTIHEEYKVLLNEKLGSFFQTLAKEGERLAKGRMTRMQTLSKLRDLYDEAATALAITDDRRYVPTFDIMDEFLKNVTVKHEKHKQASTKKAAAEIVAETLKVTRSIRERAKPILDDFKTLVIEEIENAPVKRARDEGFKEVIASIRL